MTSSNKVIDLIKQLSLPERLLIVEEILRNIREESTMSNVPSISKDDKPEPAILSLAGILDEEEAKIFDSAIEESRKVDADEW